MYIDVDYLYLMHMNGLSVTYCAVIRPIYYQHAYVAFIARNPDGCSISPHPPTHTHTHTHTRTPSVVIVVMFLYSILFPIHQIIFPCHFSVHIIIVSCCFPNPHCYVFPPSVTTPSLWPLLPTWISNYMTRKLWDEINYPFLNFNSCTAKV